MASPSNAEKPVPTAADKPKAPVVKTETLVQQRMMHMARETTGQLKHPLPDDELFRENYPSLWAWLTATQIAEAFEKERPRLAFLIDGSHWKVTLTDNALECSLSSAGNTFQDALARLERAVLDPEATWSRWKKRGKGLKALDAKEKKAGQGK